MEWTGHKKEGQVLTFCRIIYLATNQILEVISPVGSKTTGNTQKRFQTPKAKGNEDKNSVGRVHNL